MPLLGFYCPDKVEVTTEACLKACRMTERCLTLPTLALIAQERKQSIKWVCPCCGEVILWQAK